MILHKQEGLNLKDYLALPIWAIFITETTEIINPMQVFLQWNSNANTNPKSQMLSFARMDESKTNYIPIEVAQTTTVCLAESPTHVMRLDPVQNYLNEIRNIYEQNVEYRKTLDIHPNPFFSIHEESTQIDYESEIIYNE